VAHTSDDRREVEEQARRGAYLVAGHTPETQLALITRDMEHLIKKVHKAEDENEKLRQRQDALEKAFDNLIVRGTTAFALVVAAGVFLGWLASFIKDARNLIGR
jgi:hypothetical protein